MVSEWKGQFQCLSIGKWTANLIANNWKITSKFPYGLQKSTTLRSTTWVDKNHRTTHSLDRVYDFLKDNEQSETRSQRAEDWVWKDHTGLGKPQGNFPWCWKPSISQLRFQFHNCEHLSKLITLKSFKRQIPYLKIFGNAQAKQNKTRNHPSSNKTKTPSRKPSSLVYKIVAAVTHAFHSNVILAWVRGPCFDLHLPVCVVDK